MRIGQGVAHNPAQRAIAQHLIVHEAQNVHDTVLRNPEHNRMRSAGSETFIRLCQT